MVKRVGHKVNSRSLTTSMRGFLITCEPCEEARAVQELRTLVQASSPQQPAQTNPDLRSQKLLKTIATGCKGTVFMKLNPGHASSKSIQPEKVVAELFAAKERQVKHIAKIWPVVETCSASDDKQMKKSLAEKAVAVAGTTGPVNLDFHCRNSSKLRKEEATAVLSQAGLHVAPSSSVFSVHVNAV